MKATCFVLLVILLLGISCDAFSPYRHYKETCCKEVSTAKKIKLKNISNYRKTDKSCNQQAYIVDIKRRGDCCFEIKESITKILQKFDEEQQKNGIN